MLRALIVRAEAEADLAAAKLWFDEQLNGLGAKFLRKSWYEATGIGRREFKIKRLL